LSELNLSVLAYRADHFHKTISDRTRKVYDRVAAVYPASTFFFHSKAHRMALDMSEIRNGDQVLEVATGSGEMFRRLLKRNPDGLNVGFDLSPNMAAFTERRVRREFPDARMLLQAVDARHMPFRDASFDHVVSCYLYELLDHDDIHKTLREIRRVLKPGGRLTAILIGQDDTMFRQGYKVCGRLVPAFWGRLVSNRMPAWVEQSGFLIEQDRSTRQGFYPSRVLVAKR